MTTAAEILAARPELSLEVADRGETFVPAHGRWQAVFRHADGYSQGYGYGATEAHATADAVRMASN